MKENVLELLKEKKLMELHQELDVMNSADIPSILEKLDDEDLIVVYRLLSKDKAAEVFAYLEPEMQEKLINALTDTELKEVINELFMDDTVDLIEEMPANVVKRILKNMKSADRKIINELLNYPEDSAGSIMTTEFVDLKENMTVTEAFAKIKKIGNVDNIYTCYVLSMTRKLIGVVQLRDLIFAKRNDFIKDLMKTDVISVMTEDDQEEVAKKFDKYDVNIMPVVDKENRLVGIVTIDDAMEVMVDETTEDFQKMAAITPSEDSYFKTSVFKHAKNRFIWLLVLMISSAVTGAVITHYENAFAAIPLLVAFIPMVMGTGGNCGSQSSTLIIRGLAKDEITTKDIFRAIWKEIRIGVIVGIGLFIANFIRIMLQYNDMKIAITVGFTLIGTTILAKTLGCILPIAAKKVNLDPAIMAAPLISTIVDTCSVMLFFNIAIVILGL